MLETINTEFHLYGSGDGTADQALEALKSRIQIQVEGPDAFYVSFEGKQPQRVMQVTNRLAALFIERTSTSGASVWSRRTAFWMRRWRGYKGSSTTRKRA